MTEPAGTSRAPRVWPWVLGLILLAALSWVVAELVARGPGEEPTEPAPVTRIGEPGPAGSRTAGALLASHGQTTFPDPTG